jgi:iron complex outermembrane receptor protein
MDVRDEIRLDPFSTGVGNRNMPPLRREGLEAEVRRELSDGVSATAAYTYTEAKFREGVLPGSPFTMTDVAVAGRDVPLVPRHKLDVGFDWRLAAATSVRADARYVARQFMENDEGNTLGRQIPAYTVVDVKLTHRSGKFKFSAAIDNLFDRKYYTYAVRSQFVVDRFNAYPLPERAYWLTVEYSGI